MREVHGELHTDQREDRVQTNRVRQPLEAGRRRRCEPVHARAAIVEQHRAAVAKIDEMVEKADQRKMVALRVLLENMSFEETEFLEELEKALSLKTVSIEDRGKGKVPRVKMV